MHVLLLLFSLIHITTCNFYTVIINHHYYPKTTCHHCHNLQYYLLNTTKYFTSNTQFLFLSGIHHLHSNLVIQNVHNLSFIGIKRKPFTFTQIQCKLSYILLINVSQLTMKDIIINAEYSQMSRYLPGWAPLTIKDCSVVLLHHLQIYLAKLLGINRLALVAINIMGNSYFDQVTCHDRMELLYNETRTDRGHHVLTINDLTITSSLKINMIQSSYKVTLQITNMRLQDTSQKLYSGTNDSIIQAELGVNEVLVINCQFIKNIYANHLFSLSSESKGSMQFINCIFINNYNIFNVLYHGLHNSKMGLHHYVKHALLKVYLLVRIEFKNCYFHADIKNDGMVLQTYGTSTNPAMVVIKNTTFSYKKSKTNPYEYLYNITTLDISFMLLSHTTLLLEDSVTFCNITTTNSIISLRENSTVIISGSVEFSHNQAHDLINFNRNDQKYIRLQENSDVNIVSNNVWSLFATKQTLARYPYPFCLFQYFGATTSTTTVEQRNFLIRFSNNQCKLNFRSDCYDYMLVTNCLWLQESLFNNTIPLDVNNRYIQITNNSGVYNVSQIIEQGSLCVCTDKLHYDCHIYDLGYMYPGQTLTISLHHNKADTPNGVVVVKTDITQQYVTPCIVLDISENWQLIDENCTKLHYAIGFPTDNWCELFLKSTTDLDDHLNIFSIWQLACPTGFIKIDKRCQCDPVLVQYGITNCNINDQTILRTANSWISATTRSNSYTYLISLHCPFHYCLPHSSHLNVSTPNSQCQFNRSGILCGHCQQGLSTVFSSPHCQHCSSIYLLLIIPIAIAGLVLVLLLFFLNLTVSDGTINGFILYVNIISINTPVFFSELDHFTPTYTFISIANLDLGIQMCFYNGMDDYAKMWLQLAFSLCLIFIATLIIIISRYSTTMQRLTARRVLPVLATLFLLSYTKILRIVSSVLFYYSTITHLPSKHTTIVWSVDANIPLFGVRFTIMFIVCLILFLILVPFNVILLFTRTLSGFRFITKFKPLLDAYQGPYKDKFYYWTGLQLVLRAVFFGISSLDKNMNLTISIILFSIVGGIHGIACPFKSKYKNYQELVFILNLQGLYAISQYSRDINTTATNVMIAIAAVQFTLIIIYHIITYMHSGVIRNKIQLGIDALTRWVTRLYNKSQAQQFQLQDII